MLTVINSFNNIQCVVELVYTLVWFKMIAERLTAPYALAHERKPTSYYTSKEMFGIVGSSPTAKNKWSIGVTANIPPCHGGATGSIPV